MKLVGKIFIVIFLLLTNSAFSKSTKLVCDQIIDKQVYKICYSYKYKGALAVWYKLDGKLVNKTNIKKRPSFHTEKNLKKRYRSHSRDYTHSGYDRGHLANVLFSFKNMDILKMPILHTLS